MATEGILTATDVLIGMDIISRGDFTITAPENKTKLSFQIPSTHNTDYVKEFNQRLHTPIVKETVPGRNHLCSCGSGKNTSIAVGNRFYSDVESYLNWNCLRRFPLSLLARTFTLPPKLTPPKHASNRPQTQLFCQATLALW